MIQKTVYFRDKDDLEKFNSIKNKAEWLHKMLCAPTVEDVKLRMVLDNMPKREVIDPKYEPMDE